MFKSAIIGLGQIGQGYDYTCVDDTYVVTHASGFHYHPDFELCAAVDPDRDKRLRFEKKYSKPTYAHVEHLLVDTKPDVISIAVPTHIHYNVFEQVLAARPRAILCEKPLADTLSRAKAMVERAREVGCTLLVNYMRRFEPGVLTLKQYIEAGFFGELYKGTVWYSKGLLNNGSHFVDLLNFIFGETPRISILRAGNSTTCDPEPDVILSYGATEIYMLAGRHQCYAIAEMQLYGTNGRINYFDEGESISYQYTIQDPVYDGYTILKKQKQHIPSGLHQALWHTLDHLSSHLKTGALLYSDGATALDTMHAVENVKQALNAND